MRKGICSFYDEDTCHWNCQHAKEHDLDECGISCSEEDFCDWISEYVYCVETVR